MKPRMNYVKAAPGVRDALLHVHEYLGKSGLEENLLNLIYLRASQINGCAYCIDMHWKDLRAAGENEQKLYMLNAWRESSLYSERERAALAWTESLTLVAQTRAADADYALVAEHFSERERVALTLLVCTINAWNRLAIGFRAQHPADVARAA